MKQFVQQISDLEEHIKTLNHSFEGVKSQLHTLPEMVQKESLSKSVSKDKPKTPQTEVSENDIENYNINIDDYADFELPQNQKTQIQNMKNFNEYFNVIDNLDLEKDFFLIKKLIKDEHVYNCSTKNQKVILNVVNKIFDKIPDTQKGSKRSLDSKKDRKIQPKTMQLKQQKSLQNVKKQEKCTFEDLRQFYQDQKFDLLNKNLTKVDWKLLHAIVEFDHQYDGNNLPEIAIKNQYENLHDQFKQNILDYCKNGDLEGVYYCIEKKQNINEKDYYGQTGVLLACRKGYDEIVDLLARKKADINQKSNLGQSGFMQACRYGHTKVVNILLKHKVDTSAKDKYGKTGFIYACNKGYMDIIKNLIEHKIDYKQKDNYSKTGFDYLSPENSQILLKFAKDKKIRLDLSKKN